MTHMILLLAASAMILGLTGCGMTPDLQLSPEQVLAGDWLTTTNTGEDAIVTFDDMGAILSVIVESSKGDSMVRDFVGASSVLDRDTVFLAIQTMVGEAIFGGALSPDLNQLIGSLNAPIVIDEGEALSIPAGAVRFDRLGAVSGMPLN